MFKFNFKKFGLGIAIIIVFNLFVNYGIDTFYKGPKYDDFCKPENVRQTIGSKEKCDSMGGLWSENIYYYKGEKMTESGAVVPAPAPVMEQKEPVGWCDAYFSCQKNFDEVNNVYKRNVFVIWTIAGAIAIAASFFLVAIESMSVTFIFAGLIALLVGTINYWSAMQDYLRFVILGIVLAMLIYIGYKKLEARSQNPTQ